MALLIEASSDDLDVIEIHRDVPNTIGFNVQIEGTTGKSSCRLLIETQVGEAVVFEGTLANQSATFEIPKNRVSVGKHAAQLEVFVEGRHFVPVRFDVTVIESPTVKAQPITSSKSLTEVAVKASLADRWKNNRRSPS